MPNPSCLCNHPASCPPQSLIQTLCYSPLCTVALQVFPDSSQRCFTLPLHGKYKVALFFLAGIPVLLIFLLLLFPTVHSHGPVAIIPLPFLFFPFKSCRRVKDMQGTLCQSHLTLNTEWKGSHEWRRKPTREAGTMLTAADTDTVCTCGCCIGSRSGVTFSKCLDRSENLGRMWLAVRVQRQHS